MGRAWAAHGGPCMGHELKPARPPLQVRGPQVALHLPARRPGGAATGEGQGQLSLSEIPDVAHSIVLFPSRYRYTQGPGPLGGHACPGWACLAAQEQEWREGGHGRLRGGLGPRLPFCPLCPSAKWTRVGRLVPRCPSFRCQCPCFDPRRIHHAHSKPGAQSQFLADSRRGTARCVRCPATPPRRRLRGCRRCMAGRTCWASRTLRWCMTRRAGRVSSAMSHDS